MSYPLALPRIEGPVFALDAATIERGTQAARESPRGRIMLKVHRSDTEGVQRLLNFMQPGSYAQPHCHPAPENIETVALLRGVAGVFIFTPTGEVQAVHRVVAGDPGACLVDIECGVWHTIVPLAEDTVVLEIKRGPYNAATDKTFAPWAPVEGSEDAPNYLRRLEALVAPLYSRSGFRIRSPERRSPRAHADIVASSIGWQFLKLPGAWLPGVRDPG
jgi:cupin fold WbuC family metalloprotein